MRRSVSVDHVHRVVKLEDRVLRNYWVTQTYSDLSARLASLLGRDTANWCTFATWASYTVGRNMRGDDLPEWLQHRVVGSDGMMGAADESNKALHDAGLDPGQQPVRTEHACDVLAEGFGACALSLSNGNTEVFAEIAPVAAVFIASFSSRGTDPGAARKAVLDACVGAPEFEGRNRLHAGFAHWCDAMGERDRTRRSQLILAGSLELGAHEQNHLQGPIEGAMDMGLDKAIASLKSRVLDDASDEVRGLAKALEGALEPLGRCLADRWGDLMTELLGTIVTEDGTLRLDHDVPPLPRLPFRPSELQTVVVQDLAGLLERFDRANPTGKGSRAEDWVKLDDRMNFISNLFVSRHHRATLFDPPFGSELIAEIESGWPPGHPPGSSPAPGAAPRPAGQPGVVPPSKSVAMFTDAFIEGLRGVGDPPADAAVDEYFRATGAGHTELFGRLGTTDWSSAPDESLPGIGAFANQDEPWPDWADPQLVKDGQQIFGDYGLQLGMGLFMASLPSDYAFKRGVQALGRTARLTRNPTRRYVETGQMIIDAMSPGALVPGRSGYRAVRHVRLMHAAVRHVLSHLDEIEAYGPFPIQPWSPDLGTPISQLQLLGTMFSFGVEGIKTLERTGVRLGTYDREAYIHVWNLVGHQIGVRDDLLPLSWEVSSTLWETRRRAEYGPTAEGRELTKGAIEAMRELFAVSHMPGLPATGIRYFVGDETAELLGVPKSDWTRLVFELVSRADRAYELGLKHLPLTRSLAALVGRRLWQGFELYGRDGRPTTFQVSDELAEAWGMR